MQPFALRADDRRRVPAAAAAPPPRTDGDAISRRRHHAARPDEARRHAARRRWSTSTRSAMPASARSSVDRDGPAARRAGAHGRRRRASRRPARLSGDRAVARSWPRARSSATWRRLGGNVLQRTRCTYFRDVSYAPATSAIRGCGCAALDGVNRKHAVLGVSDHCIATYPGDFAQALIALDATVEIAGAERQPRDIPFAALHRQPGETPRRRDDAGARRAHHRISASPPRPWTRRSLYLKVRDRQSYEFALASAAVALDLDGDRRAARRASRSAASRPCPGGRASAEEALERPPLRRARPSAPRRSGLRRRERAASTTLSSSSSASARSRARCCRRRRWRYDTMPDGHAAAPAPEGEHGRAGAAPRRRGSRSPARRAMPPTCRSAIPPCVPGDQRDRPGPHRRASTSRDAQAVPGVLDILTHENTRRPQGRASYSASGASATHRSSRSAPTIEHDGQIVAVVVADTFEAAREAAHRVHVTYAAETPSATLRRAGGVTEDDATKVSETHEEAPARRRRRGARSPRPTVDRRRIRARRPSTTIRSSCSPRPAPGTTTG